MLKKWNDWRFKNWSKSRRKGQLRYIVTSTFTICLAVVFGRFLGVFLFTNQNQWGEFLFELPVLVSSTFVFGLLVNFFGWVLMESWYEKEKNKRENT
ncbi:TPA: hypothetical protein ACVO4R_003939 [Vibrio diabolicus]|nr:MULTISPECIES: hypothetical protein [Vibrio harveyi group]MCS0341507.1 hypothetical protein [Vibrio diabolicus]EHR6713371.1 hypothetical protein [Vibrio parahaemolyticus]ELA9301263.1 hypothetical protein [Vibrio parahaemolyticus]ELB2141654.1 hypothetical protein [Vibrio parahaemolyticus]ELB2219812.1 hypothetical protein [Vibrio parahaemolyticus]